MKRKIVNLVTLMLVVFTAMLACVSCQTGGETKANLLSATETQIVMQIEETDGNATAFDALKSLRSQDLLSFDYMDSSYGAYTSKRSPCPPTTPTTP